MQQDTVDSHSIRKIFLNVLTAIGESVSVPEERGTDDFSFKTPRLAGIAFVASHCDEREKGGIMEIFVKIKGRGGKTY